MSSEPDLTDANKETIHHLPASCDELSAALHISKSSVRDRIAALKKRGIKVQSDDSGTYHLIDEAKVRRVSTKHTGTKTREANEFATEMEAVILRRLKSNPPLVASQNTHDDRQDVVVHMTDTHMGDVVEDETGYELFNPEICRILIQHFTQKVLDLCERKPFEFDTCHLLWGGDMLTNENIYDGQAFDIRLMLADQMAAIVEALTEQAASFAEYFDTVQIVAQPGNHGKTRASGVSKQANMDLLAYRWVQDRLHDRVYRNVHFLESEATFYRNFEMRDGRWRGHLRHGQDCQKHAASTARSESDWRGWLNKHQFQVAFRGHHHQSRREDVLNKCPVFMSPSMKVGGTFAERIGQPDISEVRKLGTVLGVSDKRPVTWSHVIDDIELEYDENGLIPEDSTAVV